MIAHSKGFSADNTKLTHRTTVMVLMRLDSKFWPADFPSHFLLRSDNVQIKYSKCS